MVQQLVGEGFEDLYQAHSNELMQDMELNAVDLIEIVKNCGEIESSIECNKPNVFIAKFVHEGLLLERKQGNYFQGGNVILHFNEILMSY